MVAGASEPLVGPPGMLTPAVVLLVSGHTPQEKKPVSSSPEGKSAKSPFNAAELALMLEGSSVVTTGGTVGDWVGERVVGRRVQGGVTSGVGDSVG